MNRDDIIRMAKNKFGIYAFTADDLARFVAIISAAEREACAEACDDNAKSMPKSEYAEACQDCAYIIRARSE
jgi:predicted S18 family serine protease